MYKFNRHRRGYIPVLAVILTLFFAVQVFAQPAGSLQDRALYEAVKQFNLQGKVSVSNLSFKRDRGEMTFTGDFYFAAPVNGRVTGAVFIGNGTFRAESPDRQYEKDHLRRFLDSDVVESDFKTAVLRFNDDTFDILGKAGMTAGDIPDDAVKLAQGLDPILLKETGANISARLAVSIANDSDPGFFLAQFDKGKLNRFTFLIDPQCRIPYYYFRIDAGEKVLVFRYDSNGFNNDIWIATYTEDDFAKGKVSFTDDFDIVEPKHYKMEIDLRKARTLLQTKTTIDFKSLVDNLRAIPMVINDNITEYDNKRLKKSMRVVSATYNGQEIPCIQEDWESGLTFLLPKPMEEGEEFSVEVSLQGDFIENQEAAQNCNFLNANSSWYPRHGFLKRSTFDLIFRHDKKDTVASVGKLVREEAWPDDPGDRLTEFSMETPVTFVSFVSGIYERYKKVRKLDAFGEMLEVNFYSLPTSVGLDTLKESFVLGEFGNALNYFSNNFGPYPFGDFRSVYYPRGSQQGIATMVAMVAGMDEANRVNYNYYGSETAQEWWKCIVTMRSYRDQWIREGFTAYSGLLYVLARMNNLGQQKELIDIWRHDLKDPPKTDTGVGQGKVAEIGPIILGRRLQSRKTSNSGDMIRKKGAFVLRMLHYLFSKSTQTGVDDTAFYNMLKDFIDRYAFREASTEDFINVANEHFAKLNVLGLKDLKWFFNEWLYQAALPSYRMEYHVEQSGNGYVLSGKIYQENTPKEWFMPLPVVLKFGKNKAEFMVYANGPETEFGPGTKMQLPTLPMKPDSVELDPDWWILSEKTETKKK